jgi:hypothetical protein
LNSRATACLSAWKIHPASNFDPLCDELHRLPAWVGTRIMLQWPVLRVAAPKTPLQQFGVEPVGFRPAMFPRYRDTRRMDHVRLHTTRPIASFSTSP